ncbi:heavy metal sensor histidine kinase [Lysobacter enzymogenes]|uniref:heavy metal sensor histidine kinase n=1 Tax=Lysobacter enzymogenes TaxID=69 RepID=UPI001A976DE7|nr:heavy metal sensor histidine kinase [Lysobacter enzymogenes]QQP96454.1 heavy metal sensor histidine kinase [Lysobacter enzymogenes]
MKRWREAAIAHRLAAMFAAAALLVFALVGIALYQVLESQVVRYQHAELETKLRYVAGSVAACDMRERWYKVEDKVEYLTSSDRSTKIWAWSGDRGFRIGPGVPKVETTRAKADRGMGKVWLPDSDAPYRVLEELVPAKGERPQVRLWVGMDSQPYRTAMRGFTMALIGFGLVGTVLVALLGHWIARVGLRPLNRLSAEAQRLSPSKLSQRLQPTDLPPELGRLTGAFNGALDRLETAYTRLDAFNADVAHELRTPLTNLMGQTQVALQRPRDAQRLTDVLTSNLEELERMRGIVNDMLFLSRAGQGDIALDRVCVPLAEEVAKTGEFLEYLLEEAGMRLRIDGAAEAWIDTSLFRRAMTNLLHNAVQHAVPGSEIVVEVRGGEGAAGDCGNGASVAVRNDGKCVEPEHLARMFDRFYRVDASREHRGERHHGLGLSIVKAIALLHGGSVFAASGDGRTTVGFSLAPPAA